MKKFEFTFVNEWKDIGGFDFIKFGIFYDNWDFEFADLELTLLGLSFCLRWNFYESTEDDLELDELWCDWCDELDGLAESYKAKELSSAKKATKKVAKKATKKVAKKAKKTAKKNK